MVRAGAGACCTGHFLLVATSLKALAKRKDATGRCDCLQAGGKSDVKGDDRCELLMCKW